MQNDVLYILYLDTTVFPTFNRRINSTIESIAQTFVPKYIGPTAWDIKTIQNTHIPQFSKGIFPNAVGVIDGGYYHIQKLTHHRLQKKTWSTHKNYNLIKFMDVSLMDGRLYDCFGPYFADNDHNDQTIWDSIVENNENEINTVFDTSYVNFSLLMCFCFSFCFSAFMIANIR